MTVREELPNHGWLHDDGRDVTVSESNRFPLSNEMFLGEGPPASIEDDTDSAADYLRAHLYTASSKVADSGISLKLAPGESRTQFVARVVGEWLNEVAS